MGEGQKSEDRCENAQTHLRETRSSRRSRPARGNERSRFRLSFLAGIQSEALFGPRQPDPGALPSSSKMARHVASTSNNTTRGANMVYAAKRSKNRCPTHPGALLRDEIIPATGRTKSEIAGLLGISRQHLYDVLQEKKPVSPAVAVRLRKIFCGGGGNWAQKQA